MITRLIISTNMILALLLFYRSGYSQSTVSAGKDTVILKGSSIKIGPTNYENSWCFTWSCDSMPAIDDKKAPQPMVSPLTKKLFKMTVVGHDFTFTDKDEVEVDVKNTKVKFYADSAEQDYGFDNYDVNKDVPWKSIKSGSFDGFRAITEPKEDYQYVYFKSEHPLFNLLSNTKAASDSEIVIVKPLIRGKQAIQANFNAEDGPNISKINIASYDEITKTVGFRRIVEENDDIQVIKQNKGMENQTAIDPGPNNVLNSVINGDDKISGNTINTGLNGICESTASGDDIQIIPKGNGSPDEICVSVGANNFRDTKPEGDDKVVGNDITTGPDGICNTLANDSNFVSTNIVDYDPILADLNNTYKQAVVVWTIKILPECVVNYDFNLDGKISVPEPFMSSAEMRAIRDSCDVPGVDKLLFLVDKPDDGSLGFCGFNQKFGLIHVDKNIPYNRVSNTIPHELGHSLGLPHTPTDELNLMHNYNWTWLLRKDQWDILNP